MRWEAGRTPTGPGMFSLALGFGCWDELDTGGKNQMPMGSRRSECCWIQSSGIRRLGISTGHGNVGSSPGASYIIPPLETVHPAGRSRSLQQLLLLALYPI